MFMLSSRAAVTCPMPWNFLMGRLPRKDSASDCSMTVSPSGFWKSEAVLARNLFGATPAEQVRPVSAFTRARMYSAAARPESKFSLLERRSR